MVNRVLVTYHKIKKNIRTLHVLTIIKDYTPSCITMQYLIS